MAMVPSPGPDATPAGSDTPLQPAKKRLNTRKHNISVDRRTFDRGTFMRAFETEIFLASS
jgi:hypothetical protein